MALHCVWGLQLIWLNSFKVISCFFGWNEFTIPLQWISLLHLKIYRKIYCVVLWMPHRYWHLTLKPLHEFLAFLSFSVILLLFLHVHDPYWIRALLFVLVFFLSFFIVCFKCCTVCFLWVSRLEMDSVGCHRTVCHRHCTSPLDILPVVAAPLCKACSSHYNHPSVHESVSCKESEEKRRRFNWFLNGI